MTKLPTIPSTTFLSTMFLLTALCACRKESSKAQSSAERPPPTPTAARPAPTDAGASPLQRWDIPGGEGPQAWVQARDVDARWLHWLLAPPQEAIALSKAGPLLSFTAEGSRDAILARLGAHAVDASSSERLRVPSKRKAARIDLDLYGAHLDDILFLLSDVSGVNIVAPVSELRLDIRAKGIPWDSLLDAVAETANLRLLWLQPSLALIANEEPAPSNLASSKKRLDLFSNEIPARALIGLLEEATEHTFSTTQCDALVQPIRLRRIQAPSLGQVVDLRSDAALAQGPNTCSKLQHISGESALRDHWSLAAIATSTSSFALLQRGEDFALLDKDPDTLVTRNFLRIGAEDLELWPELDEPESFPGTVRALLVNDGQARVLMADEKHHRLALAPDPIEDPKQQNWTRESDALVLQVDNEDRRFSLP